MENTSKNNEYMLPASILIAAVLISGSIFFVVGGKNSAGNPSGEGQLAAVKNIEDSIKLGDRDVVLGNPDAPVTIIEYGDFQCPFCGRLHTQVSPKLRENYIKTGKVKMVYRNFAFLGPESFAAAEAAECAKDQGKFWAFHDDLYEIEVADGREHNGNLNRDLFIQIASDNGLDVDEFTACFDSEKYADKIKKDSEQARLAGVNSTPTSFINGQMIRGALPYESFASLIDKILEAN